MGFTVRDGAPMWHQLSSGDREYYTERSRRENRERDTTRGKHDGFARTIPFMKSHTPPQLDCIYSRFEEASSFAPYGDCYRVRENRAKIPFGVNSLLLNRIRVSLKGAISDSSII